MLALEFFHVAFTCMRIVVDRGLQKHLSLWQKCLLTHSFLFQTAPLAFLPRPASPSCSPFLSFFLLFGNHNVRCPSLANLYTLKSRIVTSHFGHSPGIGVHLFCVPALLSLHPAKIFYAQA